MDPRKHNGNMNARITTTILALLLAAGAALAEDPYQVAWTAQIGTSVDDKSCSVAVDAAGNVYISGYTYGDLGGPNAGGYDAFLTKFDSSGNVIWRQQIGTASGDYSYAVAVDAAGNAYISGDTWGDLGGTNAGGDDAFLTKFDTSGNELWRQQIGTSSGDFGWATAVDTFGNVFLSGFTYGSLAGANAGGEDAFLTKYDSSGSLLWSQQIGTPDNDRSYCVTVDGAGSAYITGYTGGSLGGPSAGGYDAHVAKYDAAGNPLWSRQIGSWDFDSSASVAVDAAGNVYISGDAARDFDGTPNAGKYDATLIKYDAAGNLLWSRQVGTAEVDVSYAVAVDAAGNVYISGYTYGDLGGPNAGGYDAFLTKYDGSGNVLWSQQIGTPGNDIARAMSVDAAGDVFISGYTQGSLGGPNVGDYDAFLVKYEVPEPATLSLLALGACLPLFRRKRR